jgi:hypothetical protein
LLAKYPCRAACEALSSKPSGRKLLYSGANRPTPIEICTDFAPQSPAFQVKPERKFIIDNLLVLIYFIIEMIWWTGLAP